MIYQNARQLFIIMEFGIYYLWKQLNGMTLQKLS